MQYQQQSRRSTVRDVVRKKISATNALTTPGPSEIRMSPMAFQPDLTEFDKKFEAIEEKIKKLKSA